ncbi:hypothetical protein [Elioraea thermophila]|uniref:hypothetical protein n=1 Tax=Elioraea thermophila TaxID=2185104 RepID=UPI001300A03A|nr:hypothetical protein [Elioraea thermophila]
MVAAMVLDGLIDGRAFQASVEQVLTPNSGQAISSPPTIRRLQQQQGQPGSGRSSGRSSFPADNPDFNRIECAFVELKRLLCKPAERPVGGLHKAVKHPSQIFTPKKRADPLVAGGQDAD